MRIDTLLLPAIVALATCGAAHAQLASRAVDDVGFDVAARDEPSLARPVRHGNAPVSFRFLTEDEGHDIALANVHVRIVTPLGHALFEAVSDGPFLMANLPFGHYEVIASHDGRSQRVALDVSRDDALLVAIHW